MVVLKLNMRCSSDILNVVTFDVDSEAGSQTGTYIVEGGAEELPGVVGPHGDAGLRAVHARLTNLDPRDSGGRSGVCYETRDREQRVLALVLQRSNIRLQDDGG